jgi:dephospho-CoA kinase
MKLVQTTLFEEIMKEPELSKLGPEANTDIDLDEFYSQIKSKKIKLKTALLDQTLLAGLGNIYVDEVCFLSGLHPEYECNKLTKYQCMLILENSKYVLEGAIKAGGTTIRSYTSSLGVTGKFQLKLHVHTKEGSLCENCSTIIKKIQVGGRGTYYCENCQNKEFPLIVGITGGIATGKSSVSIYIKSLGYDVIDTDVIARNITSDNIEVINKIKDVFGEEYIFDGKLNRVKMGELVFNNKEANKKLTDIIHPIVKKRVINEIKLCKEQIVFVDVPLLYEAGFDDLCHYVICVYTDYENNLNRLMQRDNITKDQAVIKMKSQMDIELKKQMAHFIIDNSTDLCYTYKQVDEVVHKILEMRK